MSALLARGSAFAARFGMRVPVFLAPMAGVPSPALSVAVAEGGGAGAAGVLTMQPQEILGWARAVRAKTAGPFQLNNWIPEAEPAADAAHDARLRSFLAGFGPAPPERPNDTQAPDFAAQCAAMLEASPAIASSVMGLFPPAFVAELKRRGIAWFAAVSTLAEAKAAAAAGADAIVAQGAEAGGHRAAFAAAGAERRMVGLAALVPAIADVVDVPVIAAGGIGDGRGVAAALALGASAVQVGTAFLRAPEAAIPGAWADALGRAAPEDTTVSRVFSGRAGRSLDTAYVRAATDPAAPPPAPYPRQRRLTAPMRAAAVEAGDVERMQAWAGQAAGLARAQSAETIVRELWSGAEALLG
ncbi:MAG: nitronate monooxygenase [Bauldia sp.]